MHTKWYSVHVGVRALWIDSVLYRIIGPHIKVIMAAITWTSHDPYASVFLQFFKLVVQLTGSQPIFKVLAKIQNCVYISY